MRRPIRRLDETNPKIMSLPSLIQHITKKHLTYYLQQVLKFLQQDKRDLWFPLISPHLEALLVRMIQNPQNLKNLIPVLAPEDKEIASDIVKALEDNKNVYTLLHCYNNLNNNKNVLVYKKIVAEKFPETPILHRFESLCPPIFIQPPPEDPLIAKRPLDSARLSAIPLPFKIHWINATFKFVIDHNVDCIEFPDMTIEQVYFVYSLIWLKKPEVDPDPTVRAAYEPLKEILKEYDVDTDFKFAFTYLLEERVRLTFMKMRENNNKVNVMLTSESRQKLANSIAEDNQSKAQKNLARKATMIKQLEPSFIHASLQMIFDFINEETEASLVFRNANDEQCLFLQSALAMAKSRKLHGSFDEGGRILLRKIAKFMSECKDFELKVNVAKMERRTKLRTVSIIKTPKEDRPSSPTPFSSPKKVYPRSSSSAVDSISRKVVSKDDSENTYLVSKASTSSFDINAKPIDERAVTNYHPTENKKGPAEKSPTIAKDEAVASTSTSGDKPQDSDKMEKENNKDLKSAIDKESANIDNAGKNKIVDKKMAVDSVASTSKAVDSLASTSKAVDAATNKIIDKKVAIDSKASTSKAVDAAKNNIIDKQLAVEPIASTSKATDKNISEQAKKGAIDKPVKAIRDQSVGRGLGLRKTRLIEGLSTPLESDVAMRMMRSMGWEGGPLGARSNGISEPVMPAIHIKAGAGLGHVDPKKEPKLQKKPSSPKTQAQPANKTPKTVHCHKTQNVKLDILRHIHSFLTESHSELVVIFSTKLTKKEIHFLKNTVQVLGKRIALSFNDDVMHDVYGRILEQMAAVPELRIGYVLAGDKKSLTLTKNDKITTLQTIKNQPLTESVVSIASKYIHAKLITPEITTVLGKQLSPTHSEKSAKSLGHRIIINTTILDLINSEISERIVKFDYSLTCKQVSYIKAMLSAINNRTKWACSSCYEEHLALTILAALGEDLFLAGIFAFNNLQITFQKLYHLRKIDSANNNNNNAESKQYKNDSMTQNNDINDSKPNNNDIINSKTKYNDNIGSATKDIAKNNANTANSDVIDVSDTESIDNDGIEKEQPTDSDKSDSSDETYSSLDELEKDEENNEANAQIKRSKADSESYNNEMETKVDENVKYLGIASDRYPLEEVGVDEIIIFQNKITENLKDGKPLLECLGIKNGAIIYCCYNECAQLLIENIANDMNLKTINITNLYKKKTYKMIAKINSYVEIDLKNLFANIEKYNTGLETDLWNIKDLKSGIGYVLIAMEFDQKSYDYISGKNFSIFAGVDKLRFNVSWE